MEEEKSLMMPGAPLGFDEDDSEDIIIAGQVIQTSLAERTKEYYKLLERKKK